MNGIDISSYQSGINLATVPCDFAIVKATEGTGYINPDCDRAMQQLYSLNKCSGMYMYCNGSNGEADFFINNIQGYIGKSILCVDWESGNNSQYGNYNYLDSVVSTIINRTGIKPLIYASASIYNEVANVANRHDCGLWIAQYANMNATGYQGNPWNEGAYSCVIRQYSSCGRLANYDGNLDLDKSYINADQWQKYANPNGVNQVKNVNAQIWTPNNSNAQNFYVSHDNDGYVTLKNVESGLCLDVTNANGTSGTNVQFYEENGTDAQKWNILTNEDGYNPPNAAPFQLAPKLNENLRLDVFGQGTEPGTNVQIWENLNNDAQKWTIIDHGNGTWSLINPYSMCALDVVNGGH